MPYDDNHLPLPKYKLPEGYTSADKYLEMLAGEGLKTRYKNLNKDILERLRYELNTIGKMGYSDYFLIIKDIVDEARTRNIPVGPGRGVAASSMVCYCLGITEVDPLKYGLIFERFLNPERVVMPDVDIDIGYERENELMEYLIAKYGKDSVGLLKITLLGLSTLTVVHRTKEKLMQRGIDLKDISFKDTKTFNLIKKGDTTGVFQLEGKGMRDVLRKIAPDKFIDIVSAIALYRPGPFFTALKDTFISRRQRKEKPEYLHPLLEPILKETQGVILYQEQFMKIASQVGGLSMGEADLLRRALRKKTPEITDEKRKTFVERSKKNKINEETSNKIFDFIIPFASYSFNKAHSVGYSYIAYETAYLKANYQDEFMSASLS